MSVEETSPGLPQVLVVGLDPRRVPGPWDPEPVVTALAKGRARFGELGMDVEECLVGLDGEDEASIMSEAVDAVTAALVSRSWDCVVVGGGVRKAEELLVLFEVLVNLVRQHAPQAAIAFNSEPVDSADAAARWVGPEGPGGPALS